MKSTGPHVGRMHLLSKGSMRSKMPSSIGKSGHFRSLRSRGMGAGSGIKRKLYR